MQFDNFDNMLFGLTGIGVESSADKELSLEEEAALDIAMESEIDAAQENMYNFGLDETKYQVDAVRALLLGREASLYENSQKSFESVCGEFYIDLNTSDIGMEAIRDVAARHAYAGLANLKSLISKAITYIQNLIGYNSTFKKVCRGIETKAKAELKSLSKYSGKDMSKLNKSMPDYQKALSGLFDVVDKLIKKMSGTYAVGLSNYSDIESYYKRNYSTSPYTLGELKRIDEDITAEFDKLNDNEYYDKSDTTEYENSAAYTKCTNSLIKIKTLGAKYKSNNLDRDLKKVVDGLTKMRKNLVEEKKIADEKMISKVINDMSLMVNVTSREQKLLSACTKKILTVCDDAFTMARSIQASL